MYYGVCVYLLFLLLLILVAVILLDLAVPVLLLFLLLFYLLFLLLPFPFPPPSLYNNYYSTYFNNVLCQMCINKLLHLEPFFVIFTH